MNTMTQDFRLAARLSERDWTEFLMGPEALKLAGLQAPGFPAAQVQESFVGSSGRAAMEEAGRFYSKVLEVRRYTGVAGPDLGSILDFGCGWGRITRFFLRHCAPGELVGADIDRSCVDFCTQHLPSARFVESPIQPPLTFSDGSFDVVLAYSVFSHLSEASFVAWMRDFSRVLRPGGLVCFTTLKPAHLGVWKDLEVNGNEYYKRALAAAGFAYDRWRQAAEQGGFLFVPTGGGGIRESSFYGEAVVTEGYVRRATAELGLDCVEYSQGHDLPQAFVALLKR